MTPPRVMVATLHPHTGSFPALYVRSMLGTLALPERERIDWNLVASGPALDLARDEAVRAFLKGPSTHLLFLDSDMAWDPRGLWSFVMAAADLGLPIVSGWYQVLNDEGLPEPAHRIVGEPPEDDRYFACTSVGAGALLLGREMLDWVGPPWFAVDGPGMNEDVTFCRRAHADGFSMRVDTWFKLGHVKAVPI